MTLLIRRSRILCTPGGLIAFLAVLGALWTPAPGASADSGGASLSNVGDDLYKGTTNPNRVGTDTAADAVRNEILSVRPTGGTFHTMKAEQYSNALRSVLKNANLSASDRLVAQWPLDDLQNALATTP